MMQNLRRGGATLAIYIIFGILIAVFVLNFGPQSQGGCQPGASTPANVALKVGKRSVSRNEYIVAYQTTEQTNRIERSMVGITTLRRLVQRELLALDADRRGLRVDDALVDAAIKQGHFFIGGNRISLADVAFEKVGDQRFFSFTRFKSWVENSLKININSYKVNQAKEMTATLVADLLRNSVQVSREEARKQFIFLKDTITFDAVGFDTSSYAQALQLTEADIARYAQTHEAELKQRYTTDERLYKGQKAQRQLRAVIVRKGQDAAAFAQAVAALEAARSKIVDKSRSFADVARELSSDNSKALGGLLGWRAADNPQLGEVAANDSVKALPDDGLSPVIKTDSAAYLVQVEGKREGDLTFDQVKFELAMEQARTTWGKEAAKRAALKAHREAVALLAQTPGELVLDKHYAHPAAPKFDIQQIINDPNIPAEMKQKLIEQQRSSNLNVRTVDVLAQSAAPAAPVASAPVASADELPSLDKVPAATVERATGVPRGKQLGGLGEAPAAVATLFDKLGKGELAPTIVETSTGFAVIQLVEHAVPDLKEFDTTADQKVAALRSERAEAALLGWLYAECTRLEAAGDIVAARELTVVNNDDGKPVTMAFKPCDTFKVQ